MFFKLLLLRYHDTILIYFLLKEIILSKHITTLRRPRKMKGMKDMETGRKMFLAMLPTKEKPCPILNSVSQVL